MLRETNKAARLTTRHAFWLVVTALTVCVAPTFLIARSIARGQDVEDRPPILTVNSGDAKREAGEAVAIAGAARRQAAPAAATTAAQAAARAGQQVEGTRPERAAGRQVWEYKVVTPFKWGATTAQFILDTKEAQKSWENGQKTFQQWLNDLGADGWELVSRDPGGFTYIFKRPLPSERDTKAAREGG